MDPHATAKDFLDDVNSTQRRLGHNKLQEEVANLEQQLQKEIQARKEQDMKLTLYKKTIASLQTQIQTQSAQISEMETKLMAKNDGEIDTLPGPLSEEIKQLNEKINELQKLEKSHRLDLQLTKDQQRDRERDSAEQLETMLSELQNTKNAFESQTQDLKNLQEINESLSQQLVHARNIVDTCTGELDTLRYELSICKQTYEDQSQTLQETVQELEKQLNQCVLTENDSPVLEIIGQPRRKNTRGDPKKRR